MDYSKYEVHKQARYKKLSDKLHKSKGDGYEKILSELNKVVEEFYSNVKNEFIKDFASTKNISIKDARKVYKYSIKNMIFCVREIAQTAKIEDYSYSIFDTTFEDFNSPEYHLTKESFSIIYEIMSNNLDFLSIKL